MQSMPPWGRRESEWEEASSCSRSDPDAFFTDPGPQATAAKRVCGRCLVRVPCLGQALVSDDAGSGEPWGVWGGLDSRDRTRLTLPERRAALAAARAFHLDDLELREAA